jgi:hypothetical protein
MAILFLERKGVGVCGRYVGESGAVILYLFQIKNGSQSRPVFVNRLESGQ